MTSTTPPPDGLTAPPEAGIDRALIRNAGTLFFGQAVGLIVPLLTVPYLARVLGPSGWGPVIAAQALGNWVILILEFGFELSGTRAVARVRSSPRLIEDIVHGVQSAKTLLVLSAVVVPAVVLVAIPALRADRPLIAWVIVFAVLRGFSPLWFFQGIERLHIAVAVETASRLGAALGVFFVVHGPADGWRVVALQAFFAAAAAAVLTLSLAREVRLRRPSVAAGVRMIRETRTVFACRASSGLYIGANALILSALAAPAVVAFFGGAERIIRAAINLLQPLTQAFLPRISYLHTTDRAAAERMIRRALWGVGLLGGAMGTVAFFGAPLLVRILLGPGYGASVPVLRILAALPPLIAVNTVLGIYWALPFGYERAFLMSIFAAAVTNVALAVFLASRLGAAGMAVAVLAAEVVSIALLARSYHNRPARAQVA